MEQMAFLKNHVELTLVRPAIASQQSSVSNLYGMALPGTLGASTWSLSGEADAFLTTAIADDPRFGDLRDIGNRAIDKVSFASSRIHAVK